jgi:site-specific DNA-methyltransferase (adenine-specific)
LFLIIIIDLPAHMINICGWGTHRQKISPGALAKAWQLSARGLFAAMFESGTPAFFQEERSSYEAGAHANGFMHNQSYRLAYHNPEHDVFLYHSDAFDVMRAITEKHPEGCFDMIFADPPYKLSNDGKTCHAGKSVSVNKGIWDKSEGPELDFEYTKRWLALCQQLLKSNGTIWVSGTHHIIHIVGYAMQLLGYKILNEISWEKPNPPPNLSCRYFTHSTETILWAAKDKASKHAFNYDEMRADNGGKQMKSVWRFTPPSRNEKQFGKHPTQKPVNLLDRIVRASTKPGDFILDPFSGSSTTGVAALKNDRKFCGIEGEAEHIELSIARLDAAAS